MSAKETEAKSATIEAQEHNLANLPAYSALPLRGPTAESPFDFPSEPPPAFTAVSNSASASSSLAAPTLRPIAIPQITADNTAPFLEAYAPSLLQYGITPESWRAFLTTMSAFLAAKVSQQALSHAADMGRHVTNVPRRFGEGTVEHTKSVGNNIRDRATSGNYIGAAMGVVGGAISLPVGTVFRAVGGIMSLPGAAVGAIIHKPQTPRERAAAYAAAANQKWLGARGLRAQLVDTQEFARLAGIPASRLMDLAHGPAERSAASQIHALKDCISEMETFTGAKLELGTNSLWLVVMPDVQTIPSPESTNVGKR